MILLMVIMIMIRLYQSVTFRFRNFSVSKLFHFFGGFGFGIEKIWYRKKYRIRYRKNLVSKKVSDSVSEKFGIQKSFGFGFVQILSTVTPQEVNFSTFGVQSSPKRCTVDTWIRFCSVLFRFWVFWVMFRFRNFSVSKLFHFLDGFGFGIEKVSDSVLKIFGIGKSIGFGIGKIWYRKKVSDSVSFRFWVSSHTGLYVGEAPLLVTFSL